MSARDRQGPSESQARANAEALANRGRTYADRNAASLRFSWDASKRGPRDLRHACELVRRAYRDEVPTKLHESGLAADGTPAMTAKAEAYIFGNPSWTDAGSSKRCTCPETAKRPIVADEALVPALPDPEGTELLRGDDCSPHQPKRLADRGPDSNRHPRDILHADECPANPLNRALLSFYLTPFRATMADMEKAREEATRRRAAIVQHVAFGMDPVEAATTEGCHPLDAKLVVFDALCAFLRRLTDVRVDVRTEAVA